MNVSRRARILRKTLGQFIEDDDAPLADRREAIDRIDKVPRPRRMRYDDATVGGVSAIVTTPKRVDAKRHILYLHGGGYILGSPKSHIALGARLGRLTDAVVSVIDYRLAPEHPFPAGIDDCVAAYRDIAQRVDPSLITIAGDSAGGGAALATLCRLRDDGDALPGCSYLLSPWTDLTGSGESLRTKADADPMIDAEFIVSTAAMYADGTPLDDPGVSPLFADLSGLPPTLIQTGVDEVLLSDSVRLAERMRDAGVRVDLDLHEGMWHVFQMFGGLMPEADDALYHASRFIRTHTATLPDISS